jgi:hypothetical protein
MTYIYYIDGEKFITENYHEINRWIISSPDENTPAFENLETGEKYWCETGEIYHRLTGPAKIYSDAYFEFWVNNRFYPDVYTWLMDHDNKNENFQNKMIENYKNNNIIINNINYQYIYYIDGKKYTTENYDNIDFYEISSINEQTPAYENVITGKKIWCEKRFKLHRLIGPAEIHDNGTENYYLNGKCYYSNINYWLTEHPNPDLYFDAIGLNEPDKGLWYLQN